jgi:hypothetical protein
MGAVVYDVVLDSTTISQVSSVSHSANLTVDRGYESGNTNATNLYISQGEPTFSVTSSDLATALSGIGLTAGLCLSSTITLPLARQACAGTLGSGQHLVLSGTSGFAVIQSISARQGDPKATVQIEVCVLSSDGFAAPYSIVTNGNLAANTFINEYRLGACYLNGTQIAGLTGVTVNPGIAYTKRSTDGGIYPTVTYVDRINPTYELTFENERAADSFGDSFSSVSNLYAYFRKKTSGGTVVAAATAEHIGISMASGLAVVSTISGSDRNPAEVTVTVSGLVLSSSSSSAIPAA